jgi:hypothetical protein
MARPAGGPHDPSLRRVEADASSRCTEPDCGAPDASPCEYIDRRQRQCTTRWCTDHRQTVFEGIYCRRHGGIIEALGPYQRDLALPDLDNRAPSLANWMGRDLDTVIRTLLGTGFPGQTLNTSSMVSGGSRQERSWGRSWKVISPLGVDCSVSVSVLEVDDSVVRIAFDGREVFAMTPPWIAARRRGLTLDVETDAQERARFRDGILEALEEAVMASKQRQSHW